MPRGKKSNVTNKAGNGAPGGSVPSIFEEYAVGNVGLIFDNVNAEAFISVVRLVCAAGGYLGLTSPADSGVVKLSVRVGESEGSAWAGNYQQLNEALLIAKRVAEQSVQRPAPPHTV